MHGPVWTQERSNPNFLGLAQCQDLWAVAQPPSPEFTHTGGWAAQCWRSWSPELCFSGAPGQCGSTLMLGTCCMWVLEGTYLGSHAWPSFHKQEIEVPGRKTACSHVIYMSAASPFRSGLTSTGPDVLSPPDTMHSFIPLGGHLLGHPPPTYLFSLASESS